MEDIINSVSNNLQELKYWNVDLGTRIPGAGDNNAVEKLTEVLRIPNQMPKLQIVVTGDIDDTVKTDLKELRQGDQKINVFDGTGRPLRDFLKNL